MVAHTLNKKITSITSIICFLSLYAFFQLRLSSKLRSKEQLTSDLGLNSNLFLNDFKIDPVIDVALPNGAVFLSCLSPKNDKINADLHCMYRVHGSEKPGLDLIRRVVIDGTTFRVKTPLSPNNIREGKDHLAEDPRVFTWNNEAYVMNNAFSTGIGKSVIDNFHFKDAVSIYHLARTSDGFGQVVDYLTGDKNDPYFPKFAAKNGTPVAVSDKNLIFIDFMDKSAISCVRRPKPEFQFILNCIPLENTLFNYESDNVEEKEMWHYRGGSAGFEISPGLYGGFGHLTNMVNDQHHDIHFWTLDLTKKTDDGAITPVVNSRPFMVDHAIDYLLTDPTSAFKVNGNWYLSTTESPSKWSPGVPTINRIYQINPVKK